MYYEDRLSKDQLSRVDKAIRKFRESDKGKLAKLRGYDDLTNAGMFPEEADEMLNLELEADE